MINGKMRGEWGFDGFVVSDCDALSDGASHRYIVERFNGSLEVQAQQALRGGTDLNCGALFGEQAAGAVRDGLLAEAELDAALTRLYEKAPPCSWRHPRCEVAVPEDTVSGSCIRGRVASLKADHADGCGKGGLLTSFEPTGREVCSDLRVARERARSLADIGTRYPEPRQRSRSSHGRSAPTSPSTS